MENEKGNLRVVVLGFPIKHTATKLDCFVEFLGSKRLSSVFEIGLGVVHRLDQKRGGGRGYSKGSAVTEASHCSVQIVSKRPTLSELPFDLQWRWILTQPRRTMAIKKGNQSTLTQSLGKRFQ